jgi:hypothetical protein
MKKQLKKKNVYEDDDLDYSDYLPANYSTPFPTRGTPQPQHYQQEEEQEEKPAPPSKPKYCFV